MPPFCHSTRSIYIPYVQRPAIQLNSHPPKFTTRLQRPTNGFVKTTGI